jgi:NAD(P)-dependent dehydrogenase (short-subunit alcohol dehydrogenase family)
MRHGGVILCTASVAGLEGRTAHAAYCASKAGVINMIKNVAMDYAKYGIRANCLCPGGVATNISIEALRGLSDAAKERLAKWSGESVPMARIAQPDELANAALFLCSDDASFVTVTGTAMVVDGGSIAGHFIPLVE